jgi:hypothetical protein
MAKGKLFYWLRKKILRILNLQEDTVAINALPDVNYLVEKLQVILIESKNKINWRKCRIY